MVIDVMADPPISIRIEQESPRQSDVLALIQALDQYQTALYPPESNHLLDVNSLCAPDIRFFVARIDGVALACGALRIVAAEYAEVKRMFVSPQARGTKLGSRMLARLEQQALAEGVRVVRLETGIHQPEALRLYRSAGYIEREPFGSYQPDPLSVFMEKRI